jgi:DNA-binding NtrC family response regulator
MPWSEATWLPRTAASEAPVLILGEPGSGRSTLAREVHQASPRAAGPLVELDPAAVPAGLFESELFGHRPGAFTGAERVVEGRVARAEGGTLVLDRIESLPLSVQPKLLRLLAERRYSPLGGRERQADVRFVAIGPEDLPQRTARGTFREDLYYRLEVLAVRLPPVRERRQELRAIVRSLLVDLCERLCREPPDLAAEAWVWIEAYPWPGNLRQLRNVLERALVLSDGGPLAPARPADVGAERPRSLAEVEAAEIRRALAFTRGRQGEAARLLGISRKTLWDKRRRYEIP